MSAHTPDRMSNAARAREEIHRLRGIKDDLLAALQALVVLDDDRTDLWRWGEEFEAARAAIAKATGEQS